MIDIIDARYSKDFGEIARKLGICGLYSLKDSRLHMLHEIDDGPVPCRDDAGDVTETEPDIKDAAAPNSRKKLRIIKTTDDVRMVVERKRPDVCYGMELGKKRDFMHQRNSGINHTICEIARKKRIWFAIPLDEIISGNKVVLGRVMQNIRLYRKYRNGVVAATFAKDPFMMRNPRDVKSLLISIGMTSKEAGYALDGLNNLLEQKKKVIEDGVELI